MRICIRVIRNADGWYTAVCPSLPGCVSCGVTCQEAVGRLEDAARGYLAAVGDFVPDRLVGEVTESPTAPEAPVVGRA